MPGPPPPPAPSLAETVVSHDPVLAEEEAVLPVRWTAELLAGLDWKKLVEIARALGATSGCQVGGTTLSPDGMAEFSMKQGQGSEAITIIVRLAPWNQWMASRECIEKFAGGIEGRKRVRGVYIAPGGVAPSAHIEASRRGIEVLDADALAAALNGLPAEHSEYFHDLTMAGQPCVPTCPVCLKPLSQTSESRVTGRNGAPPDVSYHTSDIVAEPVVARRLEVLRHCEVHFLREVRARDAFIQGVVIGDFVCDGALVLNPGAVLTGNVAARSVLVRPGAELHGETRILQGSLGTVEKERDAWVWTCANVPPKQGCETICFLPH